MLKTLVTEETLVIEAKGVDAEIARNFTHVILSSNSDWVIPSGPDERRFLMLDVSEAHAQDTAYFGALRAHMEGGGRRALLAKLLARDISDFDVRTAPKTAALRDQKQRSFEPHEQWWHHRLDVGTLLDEHDAWEEEVQKEALWRDYITFMQLHGYPLRRMTQSLLGRFLQRAMPGPWPKSYQRMADVHYVGSQGERLTRRRRVQHYGVPPLGECRGEFDRLFGGPYGWGPVEEDEPPEEDDGEIPY